MGKSARPPDRLSTALISPATAALHLEGHPPLAVPTPAPFPVALAPSAATRRLRQSLMISRSRVRRGQKTLTDPRAHSPRPIFAPLERNFCVQNVTQERSNA